MEAKVMVGAMDGSVKIEEIELPPPMTHQVLIRLFASGICHSQLHELKRERSYPIFLGHEATGCVIATGDSVHSVAPGDHVLVTWIPNLRLLGYRSPSYYRPALADGSIPQYDQVFTWASHTIVDESFLVKMSDDVPTDVTSVVGCAVMTGAGAAIRTVRVGLSDSVAVFGVGGVGISTISAARIAGAFPVIAVDIDWQKLDFAKRFGATHAINSAIDDPLDAISQIIKAKSGELHGCYGVDFAFDCIGLEKTISQALAVVRSGVPGLRRGGTAVLVGVPQSSIKLDALQLLVGEKSFVGSLGGSSLPIEDIQTYLGWLERGQLDLEAFVTERYSLDQVGIALSRLAEGQIIGRAIIELA